MSGSAGGLDGNPFRELAPASRANSSVERPLETGSLTSILDGPARVVQILGDRGWGKTTVLDLFGAELERRSAHCDRRHLSADHDGSFDPPEGAVDAVLIDEAQRLDRRGRASVQAWLRDSPTRWAIATTHEDLSRAFADLVSVRLQPLDAPMLDRIFRRRIELAGGDSSRIRLAPRAARWLAKHVRGDIRRAVRVLYEAFEALGEIEARSSVVIDEKSLRHVTG